jgi:hypothetical protein
MRLSSSLVVIERKMAPAWEPIAIFDRCLDPSPASLADDVCAPIPHQPARSFGPPPLKHGLSDALTSAAMADFQNFARCF